jgi:hypothetical protein
MVHQIRLTTRCASTMAADTILSGLLHGRRRTPTSSLLPPHPPKDCACPWTTLTLSENQQPLQKPTYSDVLQAPPLNHKCFDQCARRMPLTTSPKPFSRNTSYARRLRQGSWQWQSLAHRIELLLPSPTISPTPAPTTPHHFNPIIQWLPTLCLTAPPTPTNDDPIHETDNPIHLMPITQLTTYHLTATITTAMTIHLHPLLPSHNNTLYPLSDPSFNCKLLPLP